MALVPPATIVAEATVPGTDVVITINYRAADPTAARTLIKRSAAARDRLARGVWVVARVPNSTTFVNYAVIGADSETEAREHARWLWTDAVQRRRAALGR